MDSMDLLIKNNDNKILNTHGTSSKLPWKFKSKNVWDGLMSSMFVNCLGDQSSIPGRVMPKTQKWYWIPPCLTLSIIRSGSKVKWSNPGNGVVPSSTPWSGSYWKGAFGSPLTKVANFTFYLLSIKWVKNKGWAQ